MNKSAKFLSETQLKRYRPEAEYELPLTFAEQLALMPASISHGDLCNIVAEQLLPSSATTDVLKFVADELDLCVAELRAPQFLLALSLIDEYGGGMNGDTMVVNVPPPPKKVCRKRVGGRGDTPAWLNYGNEPDNIKNMRVGAGVGGGISMITI